ncbi:hypothetical protein TWF506_002039 [Arthrobotrys conoides]|uniref:Uncharacterized protein n=1 Tax=Arthrobotrys conoides TaxID=74498 RepID=A0AAN8S659_9PEZI
MMTKMFPQIFTYTDSLTPRTIFHRSTDKADQTVATTLGVIFGVIGFIMLLCLFTCCCGACRVRPIPLEEDIEKSSDSHCNGGAFVGGGTICRSPKPKGRSLGRVETRREEVRERVIGDGRVNGVNRPPMAHYPRPAVFHSAPPNLQNHNLPPCRRFNPQQPREVRSGPRQLPLRATSPAPRAGVPIVPGPAANAVPDLRFPISEGSSSDSESIGTGPTMMPAMRNPSTPLRAPIESSMAPPTAPVPRTIIRPIAVHPRDAVTRPEFEDAIDDFENLLGGQLEGIKTKIEREIDEERRQRELDAFESSVIQDEIINELDEERRKRHFEALGSNLRQQVMKEDIAELKERTTNLEYENQRTKNTLISIAARPQTPQPPVIINNTCTHRPNSRKGFNDDDSSDSGFGGTIRPIGPGPPGPPPSSSSGDDYLSTGPDPTRFMSPSRTPPGMSPFRAPHGPPHGPSSGLGMMFPEGSLDEGSNGFQTPTSQPASPRTTPRPHPTRRASIEYPLPPQPWPQQEVPSSPPHTRQPPPSGLNPGLRRPPSRGPPARPVFLQPGEIYFPSDSSLRPEAEELPSPKFRDMPPLRRFPVAPGHIPASRRSGQDMRGQNSPRYPLFSENNGNRRRSRDQDHGRGRGRRLSDSFAHGGFGLRDPPTGFNDPRVRNASITSNHVSFVPSDQFERYSAASQGFDDGSTDDGRPGIGSGRGIPTEFQPLRPDTRRRNSFHGAPEGFGNHPRPDFPSDAVSVDSYDTDRARGTGKRAPGIVTEPWVDGERERYLRNMQRMGGMEAIPSQDTNTSDTNMGPGRDREGSGASGVDRNGRFRYDRY